MRHGPRSRRHHGGRWRVFARVERFTEPALLLLLRERPAHGYDPLERLRARTDPLPRALSKPAGAARAAGGLPARPRAGAGRHRRRDRAPARPRRHATGRTGMTWSGA